MLHTMFRGIPSTGSGKKIFEGFLPYISHVTQMPRTNFDRPSGFGEDV